MSATLHLATFITPRVAPLAAYWSNALCATQHDGALRLELHLRLKAREYDADADGVDPFEAANAAKWRHAARVAASLADGSLLGLSDVDVMPLRPYGELLKPLLAGSADLVTLRNPDKRAGALNLSLIHI